MFFVFLGGGVGVYIYIYVDELENAPAMDIMNMIHRFRLVLAKDSSWCDAQWVFKLFIKDELFHILYRLLEKSTTTLDQERCITINNDELALLLQWQFFLCPPHSWLNITYSPVVKEWCTRKRPLLFLRRGLSSWEIPILIEPTMQRMTDGMVTILLAFECIPDSSQGSCLTAMAW